VSEKLQQNGRSVINASKASHISGLSRSHILYLVRTGKIEGVRPGHEWMIYEDSLQAFLAQLRSPGRKGPRGPRKRRIIQHTEEGDRVLLSTAEAHEKYGYAQNHLLELLHTSRIEGEKSGREWLIYEDSLLAYKNRQPRKRLIAPSTSEEPRLPSDE
jgi:excisionase family DNA binding protein